MEWESILELFVSAVFLPLLAWGVAELKKYIDAKVKNEHIEKYLGIASDAVYNAVESTMQTFVSTMKKNGTWTKEAADEAFVAARVSALMTMGVEAQKVVEEVAGDLDLWLEQKIEATLYEIKERERIAG